MFRRQIAIALVLCFALSLNAAPRDPQPPLKRLLRGIKHLVITPLTDVLSPPRP